MKEFNLYYQLNSFEEIHESKLEDIKKKPYFLIESKNVNPDDITIEFIDDLLVNDGVNLLEIYEYKFLFEKKDNGKTELLLIPLSKKTIEKIKNFNNIYIHLILRLEDVETAHPSFNYIISQEFNKLNEEVDNYNKDLEKISKDIKKEEIYKEKNTFDNLYKKFEKKNIIKNSALNKNSNWNNDFMEKAISSNINKGNLFKLSYSVNMNELSQSLGRQTIITCENKIKEINLLYLYSNPLMNLECKKIYQNDDYFNEMVSIYDEFKKSRVTASLNFEPIIHIFNQELECNYDIIHIKINSTLASTTNKKLDIHLDDFGSLQYYKCEELKELFSQLFDFPQIKLLILSTQNIKKMKQIFNNIGIKAIIYIENKINYPEPNIQEEEFIKKLYEYMLNKGYSIKESFKIIKKDCSDLNAELISSSKKENDDFIYTHKNENNQNNIKINKNCCLNLDFVKYNYKRIIGRNFELKNCIQKLKIFNNVCVCGYPGAGKKSFIQLVGKYTFERKEFEYVHYLEIHSSKKDEDVILMNKKQEILSKLNINDDNNQLENTILLIINFNYIITNKNDVINLESLINKIGDKYINCLYSFTISEKLQFNEVKQKLKKTPMIVLDKLEYEKRLNIYNCITFNLKKKSFKKREEEIIKKTNGLPNEIFLRTTYINCFYEEIINIDIDKLTNETIIKKLLETKLFEKKYKAKIIKIFSIFTILKLGIREDVLNMFLEEGEIILIHNELQYMIFYEKDKYGKNYTIDSSFKDIIKKILLDKYGYDFLIYLNLIFKNYSLIFRYLVNNTNYPYNICFQFHAGINRGFWFSVNESKLKGKFEQEYNKLKINSYFDDVKYFYNTFNILTDDKYIEMIKGNISYFNEYLSQISICLPTLLHFENSYIFENRIVELFSKILGEFNLHKSNLRLKMYRYWLNGDNISFNEKELYKALMENNENNKEITRLNNEMKIQFYLIKIYNYIRKGNKGGNINYFFKECKKICENNNFNLCKLYLLTNKALNNSDDMFLDEVFKKSEDNYLKLLSLIMRAKHYLAKNDFDKFNKYISECEKQKNDLSNIYNWEKTDIKYQIDKAIEEKNNLYKDSLFFFTSSPFFDEKGNPLKTESNNSFYLKYNLFTELPKNLFIEFRNIDDKFLIDLEKYLYNPIRFIYIGSDYYNLEGDLFYTTKDFKSQVFSKEDIEKTVNNIKNISDIVILGFLNSQEISQYFEKFPHVISFRKSEELNNFFKEYPYYYFYFQRCFYIFIKELLVSLSQKYWTLNEAFMHANYVFVNKFMEIKNNKKEGEIINNLINQLNLNKILIIKSDEKRKSEIFFNYFEDVIDQSCNNSSNSLLNSINAESKNGLDIRLSNNPNLQKKFYWKNEKKEISEDIEKKYMKFFKFPGNDYLYDEIFEKLYSNRVYGMKNALHNLIDKILSNRYVNIYGESYCGKTKICFELCKYFYMNNLFKEGIYYINLKKIKDIKGRKELKDLLNKNKINYERINNNRINNNTINNERINDVLLIFDNFESPKKEPFFSYVNKLNVHCIIVTITKLYDLRERLSKNQGKIIKEEDIFENLDVRIEPEFAKELINYSKIINNATDIIINEKNYANGEIYAKEILKELKRKINENKKKKRKYNNNK